MFPNRLWLQANMTRLITLNGIRRSACTLIRPRKGWSGSSTWMVSYRRFSSRSASSSSGTLIASPFTSSPVLSSILPSKVTASAEMEITGARSSCEPWYASGSRMSLLMYSTSPFALKFISRKMTMIVITSTSEVSVSAAYTPRLPRMNFFPSTLLRAIRSHGRLPGVTMAIPAPSVRRRNRDVAQLLAHRRVHRLHQIGVRHGIFRLHRDRVLVGKARLQRLQLLGEDAAVEPSVHFRDVDARTRHQQLVALVVEQEPHFDGAFLFGLRLRGATTARHLEAGDLRPHCRDQKEADAAGEQIDEGHQVQLGVQRLLSAPAGVFLRCCASHDRPPSASPGERLLLGQIRRDPHLVLVGDDQVEHAHRGLVDVVDHVLGAALQEREGDQGGDGDDQSERGAVHRLGNAVGENTRFLRRVHSRDAGETLDEADDGAEQTDQRGDVADHRQVAGALLDPGHLSERRLVHRRLHLVLALRDVDEPRFDEVGERSGLLAGGVADRLVQIAVEDVGLQSAQELFLVHAGGEEENLDAIDDHRDREDETDRDRVHAEAAALPVMRDRLENRAHLFPSSAERVQNRPETAGRAHPSRPLAEPRARVSNLGAALQIGNRALAFARRYLPLRSRDRAIAPC